MRAFLKHFYGLHDVHYHQLAVFTKCVSVFMVDCLRWANTRERKRGSERERKRGRKKEREDGEGGREIDK